MYINMNTVPSPIAKILYRFVAMSRPSLNAATYLYIWNPRRRRRRHQSYPNNRNDVILYDDTEGAIKKQRVEKYYEYFETKTFLLASANEKLFF